MHPSRLPRLTGVLTAVNLGLLLLLFLARTEATADQAVTPVLRGQALEIVDQHGQVRTRINVESDGEVVLRLLGEKGTIRVKLGASEGGSGLLLADEATEPGIHMVARQRATDQRSTTTRISLRGAGDRERVVEP